MLFETFPPFIVDIEMLITNWFSIHPARIVIFSQCVSVMLNEAWCVAWYDCHCWPDSAEHSMNIELERKLRKQKPSLSPPPFGCVRQRVLWPPIYSPQ